jgi:organic hydroperoxide reductase OsmC/OhrA
VPRIVQSDPLARARVKETDAETLQQAAEAANVGCPMSALIGASAAVTVNATLEGGTDGN